MKLQLGRSAALAGALAMAAVLVGVGPAALAQAKHPKAKPAPAHHSAITKMVHSKRQAAHHAAARITAARADAIVLKRFHGKIVGKTKLENEHGKWEYNVTDRSGKTLREAMVDAMTGKIASAEVTTAKKEAAEQGAGGHMLHHAAHKNVMKSAAPHKKSAS